MNDTTSFEENSKIVQKNVSEQVVQRERAKTKGSTSASKSFNKAPNLVKKEYVVSNNAMVMNNTVIGDFEVFSVINLYSKTVVAFCITKKPFKFTGEEFQEVIQVVLDKLDEQGGQRPAFIHGDRSNIYCTPKNVQFFKENGLVLSNSMSLKNDNQVSEAVNNSVKHRSALICFEQKPISSAKKEMLKLLSPSQSKANNKAKAKCKETRDILFKTPFFENQAVEVIKKAIELLNDEAHPFFKQKTKSSIDFYINKKIDLPENFKQAQNQTAESYEILAVESKHMDKIHDEIQEILKKPNRDERNELLSNYLYQHPELKSTKLSYELSDLVIAGFQELFKQNKEIIEQTKQLIEQTKQLIEQTKQLLQQQAVFNETLEKLKSELALVNEQLRKLEEQVGADNV